MGGSYQMCPRGHRQGIIERHFKHSHFNFKNNVIAEFIRFDQPHETKLRIMENK